MKEDYSLVSFIKRASRRRRILEQLNEPKTPKNLASKLGLSISNISNTLTEIREKELVELLNPKDHLARFYKITPKGKKVMDLLKSIDSN